MGEESCVEDRSFDEEAEVQVSSGRRLCKHPGRPNSFLQIWWPGSHTCETTAYSDWLAWHGVSEAWVIPRARVAAALGAATPQQSGARVAPGFNVRWRVALAIFWLNHVVV